MKKLALAFLCFLFIQFKVFACCNEYYSPLKLPLRNDSLVLEHLLKGPYEFDLPYWSNQWGTNVMERRDSIRAVLLKGAGLNNAESLKNPEKLKELIAENDYKLLSDFGWYELRVGNRKLALNLLQALQQQHPKEYNIVINLGTAYEVNGQLDSALKYISLAVQMNPGSHEGSEWIHINILKELTSSKPHFENIIGLKNRDFLGWMQDTEYKFPQPSEDLKKQIAYQLHERIPFSTKKDTVVGQLIVDFADILTKTKYYQEAAPFYKYAANYAGPGLKSTIDSRLIYLVAGQKEVKGTFQWAGIIWLFPALLMVFLFVAWIRNRKQFEE